MLQRLQKILSQRGIASRRHAERLILEGRVTVNGKKAALGQSADIPKDTVVVDGRALSSTVDSLYYLLHKPVGVIVSNTPTKAKSNTSSQRSTTIAQQTILPDLLPPALRGKVFPVGRLDRDTSGLLLLTNNGELALRLTHPRFDHEKEYDITLEEPIADGALRKLEKGVTLDGSKTKPARFVRLAPNRFRLVITEGRYHQVRRMCSKVGSAVSALRRVRIATLEDDTLEAGQLRPLTDAERVALLASVGL